MSAIPKPPHDYNARFRAVGRRSVDLSAQWLTDQQGYALTTETGDELLF